MKEEPWERPAALLFGSAGRFEVLCWVACRRSKMFFPSQIAEETGRYRQATLSRGVYDRLVELQMIERVEDNDGRQMWYRRLDHPLWEAVRICAAAWGIAGTKGHTGRVWDDDMKKNLLRMRERLS